MHYSEHQMFWQCKTCLLSKDGQYSCSEITRVNGRLIRFLDVDPKGKIVALSPGGWAYKEASHL